MPPTNTNSPSPSPDRSILDPPHVDWDNQSDRALWDGYAEKLGLSSDALHVLSRQFNTAPVPIVNDATFLGDILAAGRLTQNKDEFYKVMKRQSKLHLSTVQGCFQGAINLQALVQSLGSSTKAPRSVPNQSIEQESCHVVHSESDGRSQSNQVELDAPSTPSARQDSDETRCLTHSDPHDPQSSPQITRDAQAPLPVRKGKAKPAQNPIRASPRPKIQVAHKRTSLPQEKPPPPPGRKRKRGNGEGEGTGNRSLPHGQFGVEQIVNHEVREENGTSVTYYLIKWEGSEIPSWEPSENVSDDLIHPYHNSEKPLQQEVERGTRYWKVVSGDNNSAEESRVPGSQEQEE